MTRKALAALFIWMLLAAACGSGGGPPQTEPTGASAPASASGADSVSAPDAAPASGGQASTTAASAAGAADGTGAPETVEPSDASPEQPSDQTGGTAASASEGTRPASDPGAEASDWEHPATDGASAPPVTSAPAAVYTGPVSPVNGFPVDSQDLIDRKLVAVKIDNHWNSRPQSGLERADAVFEMVVESGITRFIALFHHSDSDWTGPMRSARPTDWTLVKPLNGVMLISGGQSWITRQFPNNGVALIGDLGPPLTNRFRQRKAPHNLYVNTYEARRIAEERGLDPEPPPQLFPRGGFSAPAWATAPSIFFDWSDSMTATWSWDGARYVRSVEGQPHRWQDREGSVTGQITADVLVVLMAGRYRACPSGQGSCVPAWTTVGENRAVVFADGRYAEGRWRRSGAGEWFTVTDLAGSPIVVPPGRMWIMIYPENSDLIW